MNTFDDLALDARDLWKGYAGRAVLCGAGLAVPRGGRVVVTGDNGAGKTTLLHALGLVDTDFDGRLELFGVPVGPGCRGARLAGLRRRVGFVRQTHLLEVGASCRDNVAGVALFRGWVRPRGRAAEVRAALEMVGLGHRAGERAGALNGGARRLLALAQAVAGLYDGLLLLDEPTAGLSAASAAAVLALLHRLCDSRGLSVVVVTHDLDWARAFAPADRHYHMAGGRLAPPADNMNNNKNDDENTIGDDAVPPPPLCLGLPQGPGFGPAGFRGRLTW